MTEHQFSKLRLTGGCRDRFANSLWSQPWFRTSPVNEGRNLDTEINAQAAVIFGLYGDTPPTADLCALSVNTIRILFRRMTMIYLNRIFTNPYLEEESVSVSVWQLSSWIPQADFADLLHVYCFEKNKRLEGGFCWSGRGRAELSFIHSFIMQYYRNNEVQLYWTVLQICEALLRSIPAFPSSGVKFV